MGRKQERKNSRQAVVFEKHRRLFICLLIVLATLAAYGQVKNFAFVDYDDGRYVAENPDVQQGLTADGLVWAFTTDRASNWHPVTWLSHMLDIELFGLNPGPQHLVNLCLHIVNSLLLFLLCSQMTGAVWRSGMAAALFALHPLHAESVAWIAERKDVLSAFFGFLTLGAYIRYTQRPTLGRYLPLALFFAFALMSKPMLVTLPFGLLLLDYWPLGRFSAAPSGAWAGIQRRRPARLIREKVPLFALAAVSSFVTYAVQQQSGALRALDAVPLGFRIANALVSYVKYLGKIFWPVDLAVLYPYPQAPDWPAAAGALLLLAAVTFLALRSIRKRPYFAVGWFWYLGTLVPVIGLVQVGTQAMADRYTYLPSIGIFVILSWAVAELGQTLARPKLVLTAGAGAVLALLTAATLNQVRYWRNTGTLFEHALAVTADNWLPHYNLAYYFAKQGRTDAAEAHYRQTIRLKPDYEPAYGNLGLLMAQKGRFAAAVAYYRQAVRLDPNNATTRNNLGFALENEGQLDAAAEQYRAALRIRADYASAHLNLANCLQKKGLFEEAIGHYREAIRIKPGDVAARNNLGIALFRIGEIDAAIAQFQDAVHIDPGYTGAVANLRRALAIKKGNR